WRAVRLRARRRRHADRVDTVDRSDHQAVSDRDEGALERVAAQCLLHVGVCRPELREPGPADPGIGDRPPAVTVEENMPTHNERGIALVLALFLMSALSVLGASLMFLSQTETYASMNYRMMSQSRYAAEAGIQSSAHYRLGRRAG